MNKQEIVSQLSGLGDKLKDKIATDGGPGSGRKGHTTTSGQLTWKK